MPRESYVAMSCVLYAAMPRDNCACGIAAR